MVLNVTNGTKERRTETSARERRRGELYAIRSHEWKQKLDPSIKSDRFIAAIPLRHMRSVSRRYHFAMQAEKANIKYVKMIRINMTGESVAIEFAVTQNQKTCMEMASERENDKFRRAARSKFT